MEKTFEEFDETYQDFIKEIDEALNNSDIVLKETCPVIYKTKPSNGQDAYLQLNSKARKVLQ